MNKINFNKNNILIVSSIYLVLIINCSCSNTGSKGVNEQQDDLDTSEKSLLKRGQYLATIGVCSACHTPPKSEAINPTIVDNLEDIERRSDPDWVKHLDHTKEMAGGVPFILRFSSTSSGIVYSRNITMDKETGLGAWSDDEIFNVIKTGKRKDGSNLFLFAPHSFFKNLAVNDVKALVAYIKEQKPVINKINTRNLPFEAQASIDTSNIEIAPSGNNPDNAKYLLSAIVGCAECHSHHENGKLEEFSGGDPKDPFIGVFRLGPDLPLRQDEKGFSAFPYPGYAVLYGGNLTRFGKQGDLQNVPIDRMIAAVRRGTSVTEDIYGRQVPLAHVMMWQYYKNMSDDDVYAICQYIKNLDYIPHKVDKKLSYYGTNWALAFKQVYGEEPSVNDKIIFGK